MPGIVISALFSSFFLVRLVKGPWARYPHYLAMTMFGASVAGLTADAFSPGLADELVAGNLIIFAGAFLAIQAFDRLTSFNAH